MSVIIVTINPIALRNRELKAETFLLFHSEDVTKLFFQIGSGLEKKLLFT